MTRHASAAKYFDLNEFQSGFLANPHQGRMFSWERGKGKTTTGLVDMALAAMEGKRSLFYAPTFTGAKLSRQRLDEILPDWAKEFVVKAADENTITFASGGTLSIISGDLDRLRGTLAYDEAYIDDWRSLDDVDDFQRKLRMYVPSGNFYGLA